MKPAAALKEKIADESTVTTGAICSVHLWPGLVEVAIRAGLDYLIIDLEHLPFDGETVAEACSVGRRQDFAVLVRPPSATFDAVKSALDLGPSGLLVPTVESAADLDTIRDAAWMPPRGRRRPGGPSVQWVSDVNATTWRREIEDDLVILPQIESRRGLDHLEEIARHELTTAIAVGPYDLSAELGVCWDPTSEILQSALERIRDAGRAVGKAMWMIGDGPSLVASGYRFVCVGETTSSLQVGLQAAAAGARDGGSSAAAT